MATTRKKTDDVLSSARKDLQAQLAVVRDEMSRLAAEEHALTQALSSFDGDGASPTTAATGAGDRAPNEKTPARSSARARATGKGASRRRRRRGGSKSTADRVSELQGLLADGPKSRNDLAAALKVSPARVQQLLAELGSSVSSQRDPEQPRGKLWALTGGGNGASARKPTGRHSGGTANRKSTRKPPARRTKAAK